MSYGLKVLNSGGFVQVDSNYKNTVLVASGSATFSGAYWHNSTTVNFPAVSGTPLLCVRFESSSAFCAVSNLTSSSFEFKLLSSSDMTVGVSGTINWRIYADKVGPLNTSGYGLLVKNSSNVVVFSSDELYPRIASVVDGNPYTGVAGKALKTISYGVSLSSPFVSIPATYLKIANGFDGYLDFNYFCFRTIGAGVLEVAANSQSMYSLNYYDSANALSPFYLPLGVLYT